MHKKINRIALISSSIASVGALGFGGAASAATIYNTGPGSRNYIYSSRSIGWMSTNNNRVSSSNTTNQTATTGSATVGGSTNGRYQNGYAQHDRDTDRPVYSAGDWNEWNPSSEQHQGHSFNMWWGGALKHMTHYNQSNWGGNNNDHSWEPSDSNWQSSWNNWNPRTWQEHGQSYENWHRHMMHNMNNNFNSWMSGWNNGGSSGGNTSGGSASSGDATNESTNDSDISFTNSGSGAGSSNDWEDSDSSDASISNTGPRSRNSIRFTSSNSYRETTTNNVNVNNRTTQTARSGNASVSHNTFGGDAESGDASNHSENSTSIEISND